MQSGTKSSRKSLPVGGGDFGALTRALRGEVGDSILLLEDDDRLAAHIAAELGQWGFEVDTCREPIKADPPTAYGLVVADLKLGPSSTDGLRAVSHLRAAWPRAVIIAHSGYGTVEIAVRAMRAGADGFVTKPATSERLLIEVARVLDLTLSAPIEFRILSLSAVEQAHVRRVYCEMDFNQTRTAQALGVSRGRVSRILERLAPREGLSRFRTPKSKSTD